MKRYRVLVADFDSRALLLNLEIKDEWEDRIKDQHKKNKQIITQSLIDQFGPIRISTKIQNFKDLGRKPV